MKNLKHFIEQTGISISELSEKSGLSIVRINNLIQKLAKPSIGDLKKISASLNVEIQTLLDKSSSSMNVNLLFRKTFDQTHSDQSGDQIDKAIKAINASSFLLKNQTADRDWSEIFEDVEGFGYENAFKSAKIFRRGFFSDDQLSPILKLPQITSQNLGTYIFIVPGSEFEGASTIYEKRKYIFLSPRRFSGRMLFTLAHELGHLIAHHNEDNFVTYDKNIFATNSNKKRQEEEFAHAFASCLLMPEESIAIALKKIRSKIGTTANHIGDIEILYLSRIYGVSFLAAAIRCEQLDLIPSGGAFSLDEALKSNYRNAEQRGESLNLPARPEIDFTTSNEKLLDIAINKINAREISIGKAKQLLAIGIDDLYSANMSTVH